MEGFAVEHQPLPHLADLMSTADLAIGAGGVTTLERCCLGLPSLVVTIAENQEMFVRSLHETGAVEWLGWSGDVDAERIKERLASLRQDPAALRRMGERALSTTDGHGTARTLSSLRMAERPRRDSERERAIPSSFVRARSADSA